MSSALFLAFEVWCYLVLIPALVCIEYCSCFVLLVCMCVCVLYMVLRYIGAHVFIYVCGG